METHEVFAALADPTRLEVLARLVDSGPATATELAEELPVSRQAIAKHLATLNRVGLVDRVRSGREVRYEFAAAPLGGVVSWIETVGTRWDDRLERLRKELG